MMKAARSFTLPREQNESNTLGGLLKSNTRRIAEIKGGHRESVPF
jgi:hypothetical protein